MTTDESTPRNEFPELDDDLYGALNDEERLDIAARRLMMKVLERTTGLKSDDVIVGSYTLGEVIGHGAMGTVYTATSPKYEGEVAVKILHRGDPGADALSEEALAHGQVLREAQAMAGVVHRNIVMVYEVGVCDQQAWLAMQLIRGVTLREWQQDPQHSWRSVLRMYVEAGRGLAAAHARTRRLSGGMT